IQVLSITFPIITWPIFLTSHIVLCQNILINRFEETSLANSICQTDNNLCLGGFPRLYHLVQQLLLEKPDAILLNAGDNFQGTYCKLKAPVLVANMDTSEEPSLQGKYQPSLVVERKGRKIGIIGLITEDNKFTDPGDATKREALDLKGKGADIIIVLSHCGLDVDR
ncbi:Apyrase, partial [Operophtera brumata]